MKPVNFTPKVLQWARERAGLSIATLALKMKVPSEKVREWETTGELTHSKANKLATYTRTPLGYLFLAEPLSDKLPIPDFRTIKDAPLIKPSPDLLDTIQSMQLRQEWMRDFLKEESTPKLPFVKSASLADKPENIALKIRAALGISPNWAKEFETWTDALRFLRIQIESIGVLIFINGVVGNNTHRKLNPDEFRGFVLSDEYAPLIFINGADFKSAQMFTLAHELVHIWLGKDGVSNFNSLIPPNIDIELFCNEVAAEFLVPKAELQSYWPRIQNLKDPFTSLARIFKVSPLVTARRCLDLRLITKNAFFDFYNKYTEDAEIRQSSKATGGDFWKTQNVRIAKRFGVAVVIAAKEGRVLYHDAYKLTGLYGNTFERYAHEIGMPLR